jgi:hypothetical protein
MNYHKVSSWIKVVGRIVAVAVITEPFILVPVQEPPSSTIIDQYIQKAARPFWKNGIFWPVTLTSALLVVLSYGIAQRETLDNVAGAQTIAFVKGVLLEAGYSPAAIDRLTILSGKPFCSLRNCIYVPFNDEQLLRAQKYFYTQQDEEGKTLAGAYVQKLREMKNYVDFTDQDLLNILQFEGKAITAESIPFWKGAIIHEMAHIVHGHIGKMSLFLATVGAFVAGYSVTLCHRNRCMQESFTRLGRFECAYIIPATTSIAALLFFSGRFWRPHEIQADDEIIKRTKDPQVLKAVAQMFQSADKLHQVKNEGAASIIVNTLRYFDPHPRGKERAEKLTKAYQELREQQYQSHIQCAAA